MVVFLFLNKKWTYINVCGEILDLEDLEVEIPKVVLVASFPLWDRVKRLNS